MPGLAGNIWDFSKMRFSLFFFVVRGLKNIYTIGEAVRPGFDRSILPAKLPEKLNEKVGRKTTQHLE